jgi:hypothetical protein
LPLILQTPHPNAMYGCPRSRKMVLNRLVA